MVWCFEIPGDTWGWPCLLGLQSSHTVASNSNRTGGRSSSTQETKTWKLLKFEINLILWNLIRCCFTVAKITYLDSLTSSQWDRDTSCCRSFENQNICWLDRAINYCHGMSEVLFALLWEIAILELFLPNRFDMFNSSQQLCNNVAQNLPLLTISLQYHLPPHWSLGSPDPFPSNWSSRCKKYLILEF